MSSLIPASNSQAELTRIFQEISQRLLALESKNQSLASELAAAKERISKLGG